MAHAQIPDFVFRRNGRVHLNRRGRHFSRLLAAEVCASAVVMLDTPLHSPVSSSLSLPCVTVCHHISTGLYYPSFYVFDGASEFSVILEYCTTSLDDSAFDLRPLKATTLSRKPGANHPVMRPNVPQTRRPRALL